MQVLSGRGQNHYISLEGSSAMDPPVTATEGAAQGTTEVPSGQQPRNPIFGMIYS